MMLISLYFQFFSKFNEVIQSEIFSLSITSAGILLYRLRDGKTEVLLIHPGGPFFRSKDEGCWSIPKGLPEKGEHLNAAALREFEEETGIRLSTEKLLELGTVRQKGGKVVSAWAVKGNLPVDFRLKSNTFQLEWPPRSGQIKSYPEIDKAEFFPLETARRKINPAQAAFIDRLEESLNINLDYEPFI